MKSDKELTADSLTQRIQSLGGNRMRPASLDHRENLLQLMADIERFGSKDAQRGATLCERLLDMSGHKTQNLFSEILRISMTVLSRPENPIEAKEKLFQKIIEDRRFDLFKHSDVFLNGLSYVQNSTRASYAVGNVLAKTFSNKRMAGQFDMVATNHVHDIIHGFARLCQNTIQSNVQGNWSGQNRAFAKQIQTWFQQSDFLQKHPALQIIGGQPESFSDSAPGCRKDI